MKSALSLTEELLSQGMESELTRIILSVQSVVNIINNKLRSVHSDSEDQLISWANQVWLDKLIKSRFVIISSSCGSVRLRRDLCCQDGEDDRDEGCQQ